jgi:hypothetical protein
MRVKRCCQVTLKHVYWLNQSFFKKALTPFVIKIILSVIAAKNTLTWGVLATPCPEVNKRTPTCRERLVHRVVFEYNWKFFTVSPEFFSETIFP